MGRMHGVRKQHGLVVAQGIQQLFVALYESLLLFFVELARDDIRRDPALPLRALGYFKDGDLSSLPSTDQDLMRSARDRVVEVPNVVLTPGSLALPLSHWTP